MQWECNAWSYNIKSTTPNTKISQKSQKPQKFKKAQNLGLKCVVDVKEGFKNTYQVIWAWYWGRENVFHWGREDEMRSDSRSAFKYKT